MRTYVIEETTITKLRKQEATQVVRVNEKSPDKERGEDGRNNM